MACRLFMRAKAPPRIHQILLVPCKDYLSLTPRNPVHDKDTIATALSLLERGVLCIKSFFHNGAPNFILASFL